MTLRSFGKCENCGKVKSCVDYHGNGEINNEDEENSFPEEVNKNVSIT